jgi:hypothetical protein
LREVEALSLGLEQVSRTGLEALDFLTSGKTPENNWTEGRKQLLAEARKPKAQCELAVAGAVEKLLEACAANGK